MTPRACLAFVLVASSATAQTLTRGPYLQLGSPTGITVVFRTDVSGVGRVRFGVEGQPMASSVVDPGARTEHVLRLTALTPGTRYAYALELDGRPLTTSAPLLFRTYPMPGTVEAFRLFAWGDSGTGTTGQLQVAQRMANELNGAALSLILGDIIYPDGEPKDYDPKFFAPYRALTSRMVIWPVIGNHDVHFDPAGGPWLDAFHTPANNPTGTELYYSFDYGNVHFVVLDTHVSSFSPGSAQLAWAAADLAGSMATWKVVAFHVPPYSGGTHADSASVKSNILPVLEAAGVDLVLAGHSHVYERTYLLKRNAIVQNDRANYTKPSPTTGTLYVVSGTAGQSGALTVPNHPLMAFQLGNVLGVSVIDFNGDTATGYFLKQDGTAVDAFRLQKQADTRPPSVVAARATSSTSVEVVFDEPVASGSGATGAARVTAWSISPPVAVTSASLASDLRTVRLVTAPHASGAYSVTGTGIADRATPPNVSGMTTAQYQVDAGVRLDAGSVDAGLVDAGLVADAGKADAGNADAGRSFADAGLRFVGPLTPLRYFVGRVAPPADWEEMTFDDSVWALGRQPIGYGESGLATTVTMGDAGTLFTRAEFDLFVEPSDVEDLTLEVDYDDGFVAYLNGQEIARRGVAANQTFKTFASSHESGVFEVFRLPNAATVLQPGDNFLAIEVHNTSLTSSDLFLNARLWANANITMSDAGMRPNDDPDAGPDEGNDAGATDDAGPGSDAGGSDAGVIDAGASRDAGVGSSPPPIGCGCSSSSAPVFLLALLGLVLRRRLS